MGETVCTITGMIRLHFLANEAHYLLPEKENESGRCACRLAKSHQEGAIKDMATPVG